MACKLSQITEQITIYHLHINIIRSEENNLIIIANKQFPTEIPILMEDSGSHNICLNLMNYDRIHASSD